MLGVDEAEIKAALDEIRAAYQAEGPAALDAYLDQAVEAGILTQEEADAVRQAVEQSMAEPGEWLAIIAHDLGKPCCPRVGGCPPASPVIRQGR